jgi:hypothetical protein
MRRSKSFALPSDEHIRLYVTFTSVFRHGNIRLRVAIVHRVASSARRGLTFHSWRKYDSL